MFAYLTGTVESIEEDTVVIDVNGIGYNVKVPTSAAQQLMRAGNEESVRIYTYTYLREDQIGLFGFASRDDLKLFRQLITVNGIGPKAGLALLSAMTADDLRFAILSGDVKAITGTPGIGKKTAERLILDLRDKVEVTGTKDEGLLFAGREVMAAGGAERTEAEDAIDALSALGYSRKEAAEAVRKCADAGDTEAILKEALKLLYQ